MSFVLLRLDVNWTLYIQQRLWKSVERISAMSSKTLCSQKISALSDDVSEKLSHATKKSSWFVLCNNSGRSYQPSKQKPFCGDISESNLSIINLYIIKNNSSLSGELACSGICSWNADMVAPAVHRNILIRFLHSIRSNSSLQWAAIWNKFRRKNCIPDYSEKSMREGVRFAFWKKHIDIALGGPSGEWHARQVARSHLLTLHR